MTHGPHRTAKALPLIITLLCSASVCLSATEAAAAAEQTESRQWEPLRIHVSTRDLEDPARYCNETGAVRPNFPAGTFTCTNNDILTDERKTAILQEVIPAAVKLHTDRLLVQHVSGLLQVPQFPESSPCTHFTVPGEHRSPGVSNADMVLYAAVSPGLFFGDHCGVGSDKRPIAGYLFLLNGASRLRHIVRATAHEIAHALGFDYDVMSKLGMLKTVTVDGKEVTVVNSPKVVEKAREHFNCSTLEGVQFTRLSNWAYEVAKDELMSAPLEVASFYTALTMAAFEDTGFFRAKWGMEEPMSWGRNAGCDFPPKTCTAETIRKYPHMYCDAPDKKLRCASGRTNVGYCDAVDDTSVQDRCLFPKVRWMCEVESTADDDIFLGSLTGRGSWCLDADAVVKGKDGKDEEVAGVCAKVKCDGGTVRVQYGGNSEWHACPEGGTITPTSSSFASGSIKCPKYAEVCTIAEDGGSRVKESTTSSSSPDAGIMDGSRRVKDSTTSSSSPDAGFEDGSRRVKDSTTVLSSPDAGIEDGGSRVKESTTSSSSPDAGFEDGSRRVNDSTTVLSSPDAGIEDGGSRVKESTTSSSSPDAGFEDGSRRVKDSTTVSSSPDAGIEDSSSRVKDSTTSSSSPDAGIEDGSTSTPSASNGAGGRVDGTVVGASCDSSLVLILAAVTLLL